MKILIPLQPKARRHMLLFFLLFVGIAFSASAQSRALSLTTSYLDPVGTLGFTRLGTPAVLFGFSNSNPTDQTWVNTYIGIARWRPRADSVPIYEIDQDGSGNTLSPGFQKYTFWGMIIAGATYNFRWTNEAFSGFSALDLRIHFDFSEIERDLPNIRNSTDTNLGAGHIGFVPRSGFSYIYDDLVEIQGGIGFGLLFSNEIFFETFWEPSLKATFILR